MSRVRQAVLLVDGQVVFLGVRRPTLRLIRLKMSEIILTGRKTQIKKGENEDKKYPGRNRTRVARMVGRYLNHHTKRFVESEG